ncbi:hypothetical protein VB776_16145 [Arcicella sp. DC2W]|uniref:Uncharacterized protein n=1 Tax=Arcicella gelida TaxID=2984195 RepID=A0ABU5S7M2_9BACT|nr:hypothetical protein [Arcicella sp. DC2W]MEA5404464.1 hypothetical protein [Arcicella sp. DC2W]
MKKTIFYLLLFWGNNVFSQQAAKIPFTLPPPIEEANIKGRPAYINYLLMEDIPYPESTECKATWEIFYFRVNGNNKVDSIRHDGNLPSFVTKQIIKNIYATQGRWKIPVGTRKKDFCWFIYPYFRIPSDTQLCATEDIKMLRDNVLRTAFMVEGLKHFFQGSNSGVLLDAEYGLGTE